MHEFYFSWRLSKSKTFDFCTFLGFWLTLSGVALILPCRTKGTKGVLRSIYHKACKQRSHTKQAEIFAFPVTGANLPPRSKAKQPSPQPPCNASFAVLGAACDGLALTWASVTKDAQKPGNFRNRFPKKTHRKLIDISQKTHRKRGSESQVPMGSWFSEPFFL